MKPENQLVMFLSTEGALGKLTDSLRQSVACFYSLLGTSAMTDGLWRPTVIRRLDLQHLVESEIYWWGRSLTNSAKCYAL